eukprot:776712-Rhodomonas_salina.3
MSVARPLRDRCPPVARPLRTAIDCGSGVREPRAITGTESGAIMLGVGEKDEEVYAALKDLRAVGVEIVTFGQVEIWVMSER